jgi:hypothetical protein
MVSKLGVLLRDDVPRFTADLPVKYAFGKCVTKFEEVRWKLGKTWKLGYAYINVRGDLAA